MRTELGRSDEGDASSPETTNSERRVTANTAWLLSDRLLRMAVGLAVGVWVARYLGPEQFGLLNYASVLVAFMAVFSTLGLDAVVVKELANAPDQANEILGTTFGIKLAGAVLTLSLAVATIAFLRPGNALALALVAIIASAAFLQAFDAIDYWYQSRLQSRYVVIAQNASFMLVALVKIGLIVGQAHLIAFAWAILGEIALASIGLLVVFMHTGNRVRQWRFRVTRARTLLAESWPLLLSGIFVTLYIRIDQFMIAQMLGDQALGVYSAAVRLVEVWFVIPMAIASSVLPVLVRDKESSQEQYVERLTQLFTAMLWLSVTIACITTAAAGPLVKLLFGPDYAAAADILRIQIWSAPLIFIGSIANHWFLIERLNRYTLYRHILGAVVNIGLNLMLIPRFGIAGAAAATVFTQLACSYFFDLVNAPTRPLFTIKTRVVAALVPNTFHYLRLLRQR